jgi:hypothetical protein
MFTGDANKAASFLEPRAPGSPDPSGVESFINLWADLYELGDRERILIDDVAIGFDRFATLFAFLRMSVALNKPQFDVASDSSVLARRLGLFGGRELQR